MSASDSDTTQVLDFDLDVDMHHAWIPDAYDMDTDSIASSNDTQVFPLSADEMDLFPPSTPPPPPPPPPAVVVVDTASSTWKESAVTPRRLS